MAESKDTDLSRSLLMGSEVEYDYTCHPCNSRDRNMEAQGYCKDCGVYMCGHCIDHHKALPILAHHQVVPKDQMPTKQTHPAATVICTERCHIHKDEIVKYFCPVHQFLGCTACITLKHPACKNVEYIPEAAAGLEDRAEYKRFKKRLEDLMKHSKDTIKHGKESLQRATDNYTKVLQDIEAYQREINQRFDALKDEIKEKASQLKDTDTAMMNSITDEGSKILTELEAMSKDIKEHLSKKHYSTMYIQMKKTDKKLMQLEEKLQGTNKTTVAVYSFERNTELQKLMERQGGIGTLQMEKQTMETLSASHVTDIHVKSDNNKDVCRITGMCLLSDNILVIADSENKLVKLINTDSKQILSELQMTNYPHEVTNVGNNKAAITVPLDKKIHIVRHDSRRGLVTDKHIKVNAACWGICLIPDDKLAVSFYSPTEVRILTMNGDVLQTFQNDDQGKQLFETTQNVAVNAYTKSIYVSDWKKNRLVMLDMDGKIKASYTDDELNQPHQLAFDDMGAMYLCGKGSHNIHLLTTDCKKVKIILKGQDGLKYPETVCYCKATRKLYVGMLQNNDIKVYHLD